MTWCSCNCNDCGCVAVEVVIVVCLSIAKHIKIPINKISPAVP